MVTVGELWEEEEAGGARNAPDVEERNVPSARLQEREEGGRCVRTADMEGVKGV